MDSFKDALEYYFYQTYDEPNLSIRPQPSPVFRLSYSGRGNTMVILTPTELTVKKSPATAISKYIYDSSRLDATELKLLNLLNNNYPLDHVDAKLHPGKRHYLDSMASLYPRLRDPAYYMYLYQKLIVLNPNPGHYTTIKKSISRDEYESLVNLINASGYWQLPYRHACTEMIADGDWLALEANTPEKYNLVAGPVCPGDTNNYYKACQALVNFANLDKKIKLTWEVRPDPGNPDTTSRPSIIVQDVQFEEVEAPEIKNPPPPPKRGHGKKHR